ncbi:facilitated trehalose transporter Tret1-like [Bicyclus anynana]|uniref:Facilitated trehalose transporter Tret1-like n=1 Tax=Bicyclus anynana TaxID=110368 RepID=A0A6J1NN73_BICAN|nr:facilitated trehalose transporter Tret1-like [Bicyclus anynana]
MSAYSAIPCAIFLPMIAFRFGRKICLILVGLDILIANIIFYCSTGIIQLIISQASLGIHTASLLSITVMVMSEYTSPKYRGIFLTLKAATFFWGIWVSNAIGTFFHWKNIGILIFVCDTYNLISFFFFCESPYWLATKGRFDECTEVHRWLKGTNEDSENELDKLIVSQKDHLNLKKNAFSKQTKHGHIIKFLKVIISKEFYKPLVFASLPVFLYYFSGKIACAVYALDIIKKITSSEQMAYEGMLILDGVTVVGMYIGCAICRFISRRKQLILFSSAGVSFLYILSIYLYLIKFNTISGNYYVSLFLLMGFSISICCGPIILAAACSAELAPLRYRSYFVCCLAILTNTVLATTLKISPFLFKNFGMHGTFLFYGISANVFLCIIYKYMPETKDKTIQEIQESITGVSKNPLGKIELLPLQKPKYSK